MKLKRLSKDSLSERNKTLLLFGFIYGQITGAVVIVTAAVYFLGEDDGIALCEQFGLGLMTCRAVAVLVIFVAFSVSGVVGANSIRKR